MGKTVILVSSKGGSGKSTIAVGLTSALSKQGFSVLLIDADEGARCLDSLLSVSEHTCFDLADVLAGKCEMKEAVIKIPAISGAEVLPSPFEPEQIDFKCLAELLTEASIMYDYVILDTKGQLPPKRLKDLPQDALFLSVTTPDPIAIKNTGVLNAGLFEYGIKTRLIINRFLKKSRKKVGSIDDIIDLSSARLIGIVPEDKKLSFKKGTLKKGIAFDSIVRIAARISGDDIPLPKIKDIL